MIKNQLAVFKRRIKRRIADVIFDRMMGSVPEQGRHPFGAEELKLLRQALVSQNLCCIGGQMVSSFEKEFAYTYGVPYGVASTSGTASIHVALGALDLNPGDEVITAPITDLGTIIPILYQNAIPIFADVDDTYNMDPVDIERKISPRTRAIIVVHLFGNPCDMDAMVDIAKRHGIALIEDCSQAHLAEYGGKYIGTIGDIGCFSFQQSKHMTTGDGGMTITSNKSYYERMKLFVDKGWARKGWGSRAYLFHAPNYRMNELTGAVGLAQLKKIKGVVNKRRALGEHMTNLLKEVDGVRVAPVTSGATHSFWLYPMRVDGVDAQSLAQEMRKEKIDVETGYIGKPIYLCAESLTAKRTYGDSQWPFTCNGAITYEYKEGLCPRAEELLQDLICIFIDESWTKQEVERVATIVSTSINKIAHTGVLASSLRKKPVGLTAERSVGPLFGQNHKRTVRIGIIGCGQIGRWHLDSYKNNRSCKVVAVADTDFARADIFSLEVGAKAYMSHSDMIASEPLDGVSICTVPSTHRDIVLDFLDAGINVLCEKPLAISVRDASEMSKRANDKGLLLLTAFKFRFHDEVVKAKELIDSGSLGNILTFRLMFGGYINMAGTWYSQKECSGGGVLMDNGPHAVDLTRFLFGDVRTVAVHASNYQNLGVEDTAQLTLCMVNGAVGTIDLSWSNSVPAKNYLEIYGEDGAALLDFEGISYRFKTWTEWKRIPNPVNIKEAFARQINHFVNAVRNKTSLTTGNDDGLKSQMLIEAAYDSLKQGTRVSIQDLATQ
jgi:perosamine synthetase